MPKKLNATLYHNIFSPPSRMAYLTAKNLDIDIEIYDLDIFGGEQNKPEFLKLNAMHQVPTLVHDDFVVTEARAIMIYLATVAESTLYTLTDIRKKTLIESRLFFDATNASLAVKNFIVSLSGIHWHVQQLIQFSIKIYEFNYFFLYFSSFQSLEKEQRPWHPCTEKV